MVGLPEQLRGKDIVFLPTCQHDHRLTASPSTNWALTLTGSPSGVRTQCPDVSPQGRCSIWFLPPLNPQPPLGLSGVCQELSKGAMALPVSARLQGSVLG